MIQRLIRMKVLDDQRVEGMAAAGAWPSPMWAAVIIWAIIGLVAGLIISKVVDLRGDDPQLSCGLGIADGVIGGWLFTVASFSAMAWSNFWSWIFAGIFAVAAVWTWHSLAHRGPHATSSTRQSY